MQHTHKAQAGILVFQEALRGEKKKYIHILLAHHLSSAVIPHKVGHYTTKSSSLGAPARNISDTCTELQPCHHCEAAH